MHCVVSAAGRLSPVAVARSSHPNIAVHCAPILRECIVHKDLAKIYLDTKTPTKFIPRFFKNVQVADADVASNAFSILRVRCDTGNCEGGVERTCLLFCRQHDAPATY